MRQSVVLVIIDGFGIAPDSESNAISLSNLPTWTNLQRIYPHTELKASGKAVGLPTNVMGNSEVGHLTIGSGRVQYQSLELINQACENGSLFNNGTIKQIISIAKSKHTPIHLIGLLSDGGVHSHQDHLFHIMEVLSREVNNQIFIHAITDGRDTAPTSGIGYIQTLLAKLDNDENIDLATIIGRYYAMDRDMKWDRTKIAFELYTQGKGQNIENPIKFISSRYIKGETDEFQKPIIVNREGIIKENDIVLFLNFRPDRARQLTMALNGLWDEEPAFYNNLNFFTMTRYENSWNFPVLFDNSTLTNCLAEVVSHAGLRQTHIAETEKYAHVTYFLNGGTESVFPQEERVLIPSSKVATYDLEPEMSTMDIASKVVSSIVKSESHLIIANIAAPDMVGHTGNIPAAIKALEITDQALKKIFDTCNLYNYILVITSDHGNCEKMLDNGEPFTAHTTNKVPFLLTKAEHLHSNGGLSNVMATILDLLDLPIPIEVSSESLIVGV